MPIRANRFAVIPLLIIGIIAILAFLSKYSGVDFKPRVSTKPDIIPEIAGVALSDYQWNYQASQAKYYGAEWIKISTARLAGFGLAASSEKRTEGCDQPLANSYLRIENRSCPTGFWLEDEAGIKIDSPEKLAVRFAPVTSRAEAASFVAVTQSDLQTNQDGSLAGYTLLLPTQYWRRDLESATTTEEAEEEILVHTFRKNTFGCGNHLPTGVIFIVTKEGAVLEAAFEKEKPADPIVCVD